MTEPVDPSRVPAPLSGPFEAERERTIETLTTAFERGSMTLEEYDERIDLASTAATGSELEVLVVDLEEAEQALVPSRTVHPGQEKMSAIFGNQKRHGQWCLPLALKLRAVFGELHLDLGEADWPQEGLEVQIKPIFGSITLRVPPDVDVQINCGSMFGDIKNRIEATTVPKTKKLVVVGSVMFGSLKLETVYPRGIGRK